MPGLPSWGMTEAGQARRPEGAPGPRLTPSCSCRLSTFAPQSRLAYSSAPDPRRAVPAAPHAPASHLCPPRTSSLTARWPLLPGPVAIPPSISGITPASRASQC